MSAEEGHVPDLHRVAKTYITVFASVILLTAETLNSLYLHFIQSRMEE